MKKRTDGLPIFFITFIKELPNPEDLQKIWDKISSSIKAELSPQIEHYRTLCLEAGVRYRESGKQQQYWKAFEENRAICAGLSSGMKKKIRQHKKIAFIGEILKLNDVEKIHGVNYTLIQFIAKKIDGRELDKEDCLAIRLDYKDNKRNYAIPSVLEPVWAMIPLLWGLKPKVKTKNALRTINKI